MKINQNYLYEKFLLGVSLITLIFYAYAYSMGVSPRLVLIVILACIAGAILVNKTIKMPKEALPWLFSSIYLLIWTKRLEPDVLYYDLMFLGAVITMIVMISKKEKTYNMAIRYLYAISLIVVIIKLMDALTGEQLRSSIFSSLEPLLLSANVISFAGMIVLLHSLYLNSSKMKYIMTFISAFILIAANERSNLLFVPLTLIGVYLLSNTKNQSKISKVFKIIFILLIFGAILLVLEPYLNEIPLIERITHSFKLLAEGKTVDQSREILYERAIEMWREKPFFGHGWFEYYYQNLGIIRVGRRSHAHNLLLESLAECGIIGTIVILIPIIYTMRKNILALKRCNRIRTNKIEEGTLRFTLAMQIFFMLDSMLHLTFFSPRILVYLISVGVFYRIKALPLESGEKIRF